VVGHYLKLMEKSSVLIKVPPLTAVYDVPGVAALNSVSSYPILLFYLPATRAEKGGLYRTPPPPPSLGTPSERGEKTEVRKI
jgi:hypothetical protein